MNFFIKFQKWPGHYMIINRPNLTQALNVVKPYRDDAIGYPVTEKVFTPNEAIEFNNRWKKVVINDVIDHCNTRKKFILTFPNDRPVEYKELREDELLPYCKSIYPKGNIFTVSAGGHQKERFFVLPQKKAENIPLIHIKEVKIFPAGFLEGPKEESKETIIESEPRDIEVVVEEVEK